MSGDGGRGLAAKSLAQFRDGLVNPIALELIADQSCFKE
jgi:hypothetical protein